MNWERFDKALRFAAKKHDGQYRKSDEKVPFIAHPFAVAMIARDGLLDSELAEDLTEDAVIAAALHDTVEDTETTLEEIEEAFGARVARIVAGASEPDKGLSWEARKEHTLAELKTAPLEVKYVVCADKTHNVLSILADKKTQGENVWNAFKRGKEQQAWYYKAIAEALESGLDGVPKFFRDYKDLCDNLFS